MDVNLARNLYRIIVGLAGLGLFFSALRIAQAGIQATSLLGVVIGILLLLIGITGLRRVTPAPAASEPDGKKQRKPSGS